MSILAVSRATATGMSSDIRRNSELLTQALLLDGVLSIFDRLQGLHLAQICFVKKMCWKVGIVLRVTTLVVFELVVYSVIELSRMSHHVFLVVVSAAPAMSGTTLSEKKLVS